MRNLDMDKVARLIAAVGADVILPRFRALQDHEVMEKGLGDIVTAADLEAEERLTTELPALLPGSLVVGEEAHHVDPTITARFAGDAPVWVIDPLDGTRNFSKGSTTFCMLVALVQNQTPRMAWLVDPSTGRIAMAEEGGGATLDGTPMKTGPGPALDEMVGQLNLNWYASADRAAVRAATEKRFGTIHRLQCAGHDFFMQSQGLRHFSFYRRLWPWDHAVGVLMRRESGGVVGRIDDAPYRAGDRVEGLLSAPDPDSWQEIRTFIRTAAPANPS